jgi:hypothetical protein
VQIKTEKENSGRLQRQGWMIILVMSTLESLKTAVYHVPAQNIYPIHNCSLALISGFLAEFWLLRNLMFEMNGYEDAKILQSIFFFNMFRCAKPKQRKYI